MPGVTCTVHARVPSGGKELDQILASARQRSAAANEQAEPSLAARLADFVRERLQRD